MLNEWRQLLDLVNENEFANLVSVQQFFNYKFSYAMDYDLWYFKDHWATPLEFIHKGAGDCEDFAIAKYFTLKYMGIDVDDLELMYCLVNESKQYHMVLLYNKKYILDNLINPIYSIEESMKRITPVYSFNERSFWLHNRGRGIKEIPEQLNNMSKWTDLLERMSYEKT